MVKPFCLVNTLLLTACIQLSEFSKLSRMRDEEGTKETIRRINNKKGHFGSCMGIFIKWKMEKDLF
jgi:hypothetical protein